MNVSQTGFLQGARQRSLVELRVAPGPRYGPYIHDASRTVCPKQADEFLERALRSPRPSFAAASHTNAFYVGSGICVLALGSLLLAKRPETPVAVGVEVVKGATSKA